MEEPDDKDEISSKLPPSPLGLVPLSKLNWFISVSRRVVSVVTGSLGRSFPLSVLAMVCRFSPLELESSEESVEAETMESRCLATTSCSLESVIMQWVVLKETRFVGVL